MDRNNAVYELIVGIPGRAEPHYPRFVPPGSTSGTGGTGLPP